MSYSWPMMHLGRLDLGQLQDEVRRSSLRHFRLHFFRLALRRRRLRPDASPTEHITASLSIGQLIRRVDDTQRFHTFGAFGDRSHVESHYWNHETYFMLVMIQRRVDLRMKGFSLFPSLNENINENDN
ncbi:hypothetical protein MPTK1_7g08100 [Marchantia polymorpha subsp. ruderalis]|uniref:Uncharacterized protein n=2 Tax=Marchantia polymorpha TaxID=3197 RepID=A0AAF6BXA7_MARPO|nr:hypothetical protein MARPO_0146s0010 [Marchantia polymorpha]BBN16641.1 hypothetical protein Mp_7g08100 [Marchantia polymorpha subsp. ruderalis]|eukprot:PTQ29188.1 hypothetical protein MARPO_0146s0010 [Marchantia polymorpha]